jgi:hypothetical protein
MSALSFYVMVVISWPEPQGVMILNDALIFSTLEECEEFQHIQAVDALSYFPVEKIEAGKFKVLCVDGQYWGAN